MLRRSRLLLALVAVVAVACGSPPKAKPMPPTVTPIVTGDPAPGPGADPTPGPTAEQPLPLWSNVKTGRLANGLTYYVMRHKQPENRAAMWLAVNAGSLQEDDDQQGLAHFVEHMAFNGTAKYPKQAIIDYLEKIGMEFGPDVNAYTSFDETVYQLQVPTDDASYVAKGLDILRQWAGSIAFDPVEVDKERGVVLEEWRLGRGAEERVFRKQASVIFGGTRYAERLPIGKPEIIKSAPGDAARRYYRDWYRPDLMAVIVVGDLDPDALVAQVSAVFGDLTNPATPRTRPGGGALVKGEPKIAIDTDPELRQATVELSAMFPHRRESHGSDYRWFVIDALYHEMLGARMQRLARQPGAPFVMAFSSTGSSTREVESFSRSALAKDGQILPTLAVLLDETTRVERHGFTAAEFELAKASYLRRTANSAVEWDQEEAAGYADELTRHFFEHELVIGRVAEDELARKYTPTITLDEVNHAAVGWSADAAHAITVTAPAKAKAIPSVEEVRAALVAAAGRTLEPWVEQAVPTELMATAPTAGTITNETPADDLGVVRWTLSNGAKVIVLPTTFDNQRVVFEASSPGGTAQWKDPRWKKARLAGAALSALGVGALSADQLDRFLATKRVNVWPTISETDEGLGGETTTADLPTLLQLIHLRMTAPRRDPEAFAAWKAGRAELLARRDLSPEVGFGDELTATLSGGHKRRKPLTAADVRALDLDESLAAWRDRFGDASDFTFTFVGNLDLATLRPLVETYLASLPAAGRRETRKDIGVKPPKAVVRKVVKRGVEPKAAVQIVFHDEQPWSRADEADVSALAAVLDIRLREILREDMGGVYGVGVWGWISRQPTQRRSFVVRFGCAPENAKALEAAVMTEIARVQKDGVDASYLDKVRETKRRSHELELKDNNYWLDLLGTAAAYGDDPHDDLRAATATDAMTVERVKAAAARYLSPKRMVVGVLLPVN